MIPKAYITAWQKNAPWQFDFQVEQDLIIERALVEIYSDPFLKERLAFRGGTALHKIHLKPQARYSEDIDLVQIKSEPFGPVIDRLRDCLSFLGVPVIKQKRHNNTLVFSIESEEENVTLKLKVEVNCREHFAILGFEDEIFKVDTLWYKGEAKLTTYQIEELLATKLRALYQRKKGRDLFDMWYSLSSVGMDTDKIISTWKAYMQHEGHTVSQKEFIANLEKKAIEEEFLGDIAGLLRPGIKYDNEKAYEFVKANILMKI